MKNTKKKKIRKEVLLLKEREDIYIYIVDLLGNYLDCIISCLSMSVNKNKIHFIIGTTINTLDENLYKDYNIEELYTFSKKTTYSEILSKITKKIRKGTICIIDSNIRFIKQWDLYYLKEMYKSGDNTVLTSWVWNPPIEYDYSSIKAYNNIVYEFSDFNNFLPVLKYNKDIEIEERTSVYPIPFIFNMFIFCYSDVIKKVKFDPNLSFDEQKALYSLRLWSHGFDLSIPTKSHVYRITPESNLEDNEKHPFVSAGLFNIYSYESNHFPMDYSYGLGRERTLQAFYELIHYINE